ncbi:gastrula zinc finger protein XlCGF32.1-like [Centruroides sculpturatus]|uniref:gastrula zinc finger protein XlCGF32.1-like n=1 Tax=Centruroides sculpturatus TaxID=218467 RepID=UPI000C6CBFD0|nr:gastrula zinc finger protein XlCGF32.1-like [Centruroides sculpturatus]
MQNENSTQVQVKSKKNRFQCSECPKTFAFKSALKNHNLTHTKEKPHKCEQWNKAFQYKWQVANYFRQHTEAVHLCNTCFRAFTTLEELVKHGQNHIPLRNAPYVCTECGTNFTDEYAFQTHKYIHALSDVRFTEDEVLLYEENNKAYKDLMDHLSTHLSP